MSEETNLPLDQNELLKRMRAIASDLWKENRKNAKHPACNRRIIKTEVKMTG